MAPLSDHDKRILLGPDFLEKERIAEQEKAARGGRRDPEEQQARLRSWRGAGMGLAVIGGILCLSHISPKSASYDPRLSVLGAVVAIAGLAIATIAHWSLRKGNTLLQ